MKRKLHLSLRWRFTIACVSLVSALIGLFAAIVYVENERAEDHLLMTLMQREVDEYARVYRDNQQAPPPRSTQLRSYIVDPQQPQQLPPELRGVAPGITHDILIDGRNYQVANFTLGDRRFYLTYDITQIERRTRKLEWLLLAGVILGGLLAGYVSWRISKVVIAPVAQLAAQIRDADAQGTRADFASRYDDYEVGAIARAFDAYLQRIGEFMSRERAFTEDASHELRTPVAVIGTAAERLVGDPALPSSLLAPVQRIQRAARQMQVSLQALLYMAREQEPQASALELAPAGEIVVQVVEGCQHLLAGKPLRLETRIEGGELMVPRGLVLIVVTNLLHNAINHSAEGVIGLSLVDDRLTINDSGPGIAEAELPRIFDRHYRGAHSSGQGLGLHIIKRICDRQQWPIRVSSTVGTGTSFSIWLTRGTHLTNS